MTRGAHLHALSGQGPFGFAGKTIYVHGITTIAALLDQTQRFNTTPRWLGLVVRKARVRSWVKAAGVPAEGGLPKDSSGV
jgi:hypothetical protein